MASNIKPYRGRITKWKRRIGYNGDEFIVGEPIGHPEFKDWIITSKVKDWRENMIVTENSRYILDGPEQEQELPCPRKNYTK